MSREVSRGGKKVGESSAALSLSPLSLSVLARSLPIIMPWEMFVSEYNVWPEARGPTAPMPANVVLSAPTRGPTVSEMSTPADEANAARSKIVLKPEKEETLIHIYPRSPNQPVPVPIYSAAQLERMSVIGRKQVADKLQESIKGTAVSVPELQRSSHPEVVVAWILEVQVQLANGAGLDVTAASFGVGTLERPSV